MVPVPKKSIAEVGVSFTGDMDLHFSFGFISAFGSPEVPRQMLEDVPFSLGFLEAFLLTKSSSSSK